MSEWARQAAVTAAVGVVAATGAIYMLGALAGSAFTFAPQGAAGLADARSRAGRAESSGEKEPARSTTSSGVGAAGSGAAIYESTKAVDEYLLFHFAPAKLLMPFDFGPRDAACFPARCAALAAKHAPVQREGRVTRALDVGCAVGGATFELAKAFTSVTGLDFSHAFVNTAKRLQAGERLPCTALEEGTLSSWFVASAPEGVDLSSVTFRQGDACALPPLSATFGPFDCILASNLLCRLPDPSAFLAALPALLTDDGVAVVISPYSWLPEWTPQNKWLGGLVRGGDSVHSAPAFIELMEGLGLELVEQSDVPFLIREHARKFQWGCSHATVWRRRAASAE